MLTLHLLHKTTCHTYHARILRTHWGNLDDWPGFTYMLAGPRGSGKTTLVNKVLEAVCSFYKSDAAFVHFDIVNVMEQPNPHDCGVLALANATELAHNCDPALCHWDVKRMREHLLLCLGRLNGFLLVGRGVFLLVYEYGRQ